MDSLFRAQDYSVRYRADVTSHGGAEALITAFDTQTVVEVQSLAAMAGGQRLRRRMNNESNFPPKVGRLVLGCIDADFCKYILVGIRKALAEIYTMHSFAPFFNLKVSAKNRQHFFANAPPSFHANE